MRRPDRFAPVLSFLGEEAESARRFPVSPRLSGGLEMVDFKERDCNQRKEEKRANGFGALPDPVP